MAKYIKTEQGYKRADEIENLATEVYADNVHATAINAQNSANTAQNSANTAQSKADSAYFLASTANSRAQQAQDTADIKMDANNPVGTGSFSMGRKNDVDIGKNSYAFGENVVAESASQFTEGKYNIYSDIHAVITHEVKSNATRTTEIGIGVSLYLYYAKNCYLNRSEQVIFQEIARVSTEGKFNYEPSRLALTLSKLFEEIGPFWLGVSTSYYYPPFDTGNVYYYDESVTANAYVNTQYLYLTNIHRVTNFKQAYTSDSIGTYVHVVGNGASDTERSNAHTLDWEGNAWYAGDVYVGSTSGTNKDEGSKKLATEEYVLMPRSYFLLTDSITGGIYKIQMQNGNLTSALSMEDTLIDFVYTINDDNTYTITDWKGTYHGQPSTEMIIPNLPNIIV